jgi:hypothetical protein
VAPKETPQPPGESELQAQLGDAWHVYRALLDATTDLRPDWKYYGQKYGWTLKLFAGKRNLCFVGPHAGELMVAFLFGERDVERVLQSDVAQSLKDELMAAKPYAEGRPLRIRVRKAEDLPPIMALLEIKRTPLKPPRPRESKAKRV